MGGYIFKCKHTSLHITPVFKEQIKFIDHDRIFLDDLCFLLKYNSKIASVQSSHNTTVCITMYNKTITHYYRVPILTSSYCPFHCEHYRYFQTACPQYKHTLSRGGRVPPDYASLPVVCHSSQWSQFEWEAADQYSSQLR